MIVSLVDRQIFPPTTRGRRSSARSSRARSAVPDHCARHDRRRARSSRPRGFARCARRRRAPRRSGCPRSRARFASMSCEGNCRTADRRHVREIEGDDAEAARLKNEIHRLQRTESHRRYRGPTAASTRSSPERLGRRGIEPIARVDQRDGFTARGGRREDPRRRRWSGPTERGPTISDR